MTFLFIVKILGDLLLYFAAVASLSNFITPGYPLLLPVIVFAISSGFAQFLWNKKDSLPILKKGKHKVIVRILPMLPCLFIYTFALEAIDFILLIPPTIYVGLIIYKGKFNLIHDEYIKYFRNLFVSSIFVFIICILLLDWHSFLLYESGFIICGIFLMRQLRLYTGNDLKGNFVNLSSMLSIVLISGVMFCIVYVIIQNGGYVWSIVRYPVSFVIYLFSFILSLILWLFDFFISIFEKGSTTTPYFDTPKFNDSLIENIDSTQTFSHPMLETLFIVAIAIAIFLVIFKMLGNLHKEFVIVSDNNDYEIVSPSPHSRKLKPSKLFKNNREKIRLSYIKYLKGLEKEYGKFGASNTTKDIYDKTSDYSDKVKVLHLRELYLRARYDLEGEISNDDVHTAKKLSKEITRN